MSPSSVNLKKHFEDDLKSISDKLATRSALSKVELNFLSMFQIPVYMIINKLASVPNGHLVLDKIKPALAEMLAYEIVYEYLSRASSIATKQKEKMDADTIGKITYSCSKDGCHSDIMAGLSTMQKGNRDAARIAYSLVAQANENLQKALTANSQSFEEINKLKAHTLQRSNPKLFESYIFSGTLQK